jgi:hypothetical protein
MLSEEQFSSCIEALTRLGLVEKVPGERRGHERLRLKLETEGVLGRILGGEVGEVPKGSGLVPWFSCALLKIVLDERGVVATKEEFTGMAAVLAGFMSQAELSLRLQPGDDRPVISQRHAKPEGK